MKRSDFGIKLKAHDWYYAYSDDHSVWRSGRAAEAALRETREELDCPFTMSELQAWAHKMILEDFAEEEPGEWYRQPRKYKCIAPTKREELMPRAFHDEITHWMTLGSSAVEISRVV